jgi:hypothetical protein
MKIKNIEEIMDKQIPALSEYSNFDGFVITFDNDTTLALIVSSGQSCCEQYGAVTTEENLQDYIGAEYIQHDIVDQELAVRSNIIADSNIFDIPGLDEGDIIFLNVQTDRGTLQFSVYNSHNGYYGHSAYVYYQDEKVLDVTL